MSSLWSWRQAVFKSGLSSTTKLVLQVIAAHINDMGEGCYPSTKRIAAYASLSERAVCTHIDTAREAGWLQVKEHGFAGQKWKRHEYRALFPQRTERGSAPLDNEKALNDVPEGTEPGSNKALNDVQSNSPQGISSEFSPPNPPSGGDPPAEEKPKRKKTPPKSRITQNPIQPALIPAQEPDDENTPVPFATFSAGRPDLGSWRDFCNTELGWDRQRCADTFTLFREYYTSGKGRKISTTPVAWTARWRTWCRKEGAERGNARAGGGYRSAGERDTRARLADTAALAAALRDRGDAAGVQPAASPDRPDDRPGRPDRDDR